MMEYRSGGNFRCSFSSVEAKKLTANDAAMISTMLKIHLKHNSIQEAKAETWNKCLLNGVKNTNKLALFSRLL